MLTQCYDGGVVIKHYRLDVSRLFMLCPHELKSYRGDRQLRRQVERLTSAAHSQETQLNLFPVDLNSVTLNH